MRIFGSHREIKELQERVDKLERAARLLELEWSSTYDKFRSILARIAKRQERLASDAGSQEEDGHPVTETTSSSSLSQRQQEINARILMRRNRTSPEREQ